MQAVWGMATDAGGRRSVNEDSVLALPPVFLVADGMGGHVHGAMASACVMETFSAYARDVRADVEVHPEEVQAVVRAAQDRIRTALAEVQEGADGHHVTAGSTVAGAILTTYEAAPYWLVFNVGDSRVYRYCEGELSRISVDHSVVQELIDSGAIDDEQARTHPQRNIITRAVGSGVDVEPDFWMLYAGRNDRLLICSDGLVNEISEEQIRAALATEDSPDGVAHALLALAVSGGARDNVSIVVVDLHADDRTEIGTTAPRGASDADEFGDAEETVPQDRSVVGSDGGGRTR